MRLLTLSVFYLLLSLSVYSQSAVYPGWAPYGGVNNIAFNPAISDSRHILDINLVAASVFGSANGFTRGGTKNSFFPFNFKSRYETDNVGSEVPYMHENLSIQGPSILITAGLKRKNNWAFGASTYMNSVFDLNNIDQSLFKMFALNQYDSLPDTTFKNQNVFYASWQELKATAGYTVYNKGKHYVKFGASARFLKGVAAFEYSANELRIQNGLGDTTLIGLENATSFRSDDLKLNEDDIPLKSNAAKQTMSAEFGLIYEYRALKDTFNYSMNERNWIDHEDIKYRVSGGVSFAPAAKIQYQGQSFDLTSSKANISYTDIESATNLNRFYKDVMLRFPDSVSQASLHNVTLPSRLNTFVDVNILKGLGVNISAVMHPGQKGDFVSNVFQPDYLTLAPRFDRSLYGASLPITFQKWDALGRSNVLLAGAAIRFGPLYVAAHYNFSASQIAQVNFGIKIPVRYKRHKDSDGDFVDDKGDLCPLEPGQFSAKGCLDSDMDSIPNSIDRCDWEFGPTKYAGCPDNDGDGIPDVDDRCKDDFGLSQYEGCPDNDVDCIPDDVDECPTISGPFESMGCPDYDDDGVYDYLDDCDSIPGPKEFHGCPDRDGDGIFDMDDDCPDNKGDALDGGCPDTDNDGMLDKDDWCPNEKGVWRNHGCPLEDTDDDGVYDFDDDCPEEPGLKTNRGCPKKTKFPNQKKQVILKISGGYELDKRNISELEDICKLLNDYPDYTVMVIGYSDSIGTDEEKKALSVQRSTVAKDFILNKGIDDLRIATRHNGDKDPLALPGEADVRRYGRIEVYVHFKEE